MENKQRTIIIVVVVIVVAAGIGFWYSQNKKATPTAPAANAPATSVTQEASKSIGATIFEKTQDPLKTKIPETNPLKRVIINPFK